MQTGSMFQAGGDFNVVGGSTLAFKKERKKGFDLLGGGLDEVILGLGLYKCVEARGAGMRVGCSRMMKV